MRVIDHRPANGGGSCSRCGDSLDLVSIKRDDVWYCGTACAEEIRASDSPSSSVPEHWLYARPRRFFRKRHPKELNPSRSGE